jgi:hypothetical protein
MSRTQQLQQLYGQNYHNNAMNNLNDDPTFRKIQETTSEAPLKYITTNFSDLKDAKTMYNYFYGIGTRPEQPTKNVIDQESQLIIPTLNNDCRIEGPLPLPTIPFQYGKSMTALLGEDKLRTDWDIREFNSCQDRDLQFYNRVFEVNKRENKVEPQDLRFGINARFN